ncbi:fucose permease [Motilibacter rhizosphaerae]|uniref:Fucose permease n=1 Tax=Motilibacter rhizosphaerae TaxID=598652 RepID=A0A4Q7NBF5_9ACTN|nr:MFS transporter [Motilibacter rhizosphaerae]RZS79947.1 fucose permease [Motilibacter rhizosphaerae]
MTAGQTVASPRAADRASLARWRWAVTAAFALGGITVSTWGPRLPDLRADLHVRDAAIGLILSAFTVGSITGLSAASTLLARLGGRGALRSLLLLVALGLAVIGAGAGIAHEIILVVLGFAAVGFGIGALDVSINVEGAEVERAYGTTLMPLMHAAWSAGAVVGAATGAACAALGVSLQAQFLAEAVLLALAAGIATRAVPDAVPAEATGERLPLAQRLRTWASGWTDLRLLLIGLVMLGVELGEGSANNWLTLAVRDEHHQREAVAALFFVAFAAGETIARVVGGPLVDRVGRVRAVRATTAAGVVGMLLFILAAPAWLVLIGTVLWAVGVSMGFPLGMSAAAESGPNPAARVSVVASIGYVANLAGPPVVGALSQAFGLLDALWLVLVLMAVAFVVSGALHRDEPARTP